MKTLPESEIRVELSHHVSNSLHPDITRTHHVVH